MRRTARPAWLRYLVALLAVFAVMQLRIYLGRLLHMDGPPLIMMVAAVIVAAAFGGIGPGVFATVAGAAVSDYLFIEPRGTLLGNGIAYDIRLALFVGEGIFVSWVIRALRRSSQAGRQMERNLRLIADNTSDVIFAYDMAGQLLYVNPAFETLTGNSIAELRENPFMNYVHPDDSVRMQELFEGLFDGKSFKDVEYRIIAHDGRVKWCRATWGPLLDEFANQIGVQGRETDITEPKRSESTLRFLADACAVLAAAGATDGPGGWEAALERIARVAVPQFADWCLIDVLTGDDNRSARTVAAAHADASKRPWVDELRLNYPPAAADPGSADVRSKALRTAEPEIVPVASAAWVSGEARDARHLKLLHNLAPRSLLCVPLKAAGRTLGVITFVSSGEQRRYTGDDLLFATDLARRVAEFLARNRAATGATAAA
jgi:PAS domain S-box-containing protein